MASKDFQMPEVYRKLSGLKADTQQSEIQEVMKQLDGEQKDLRSW